MTIILVAFGFFAFLVALYWGTCAGADLSRELPQVRIYIPRHIAVLNGLWISLIPVALATRLQLTKLSVAVFVGATVAGIVVGVAVGWKNYYLGPPPFSRT